VTTTALLPVLEPLSKATSTHLAPVNYRGDIRLHLSLDNEGKRFIAESVAYRKKFVNREIQNRYIQHCMKKGYTQTDAWDRLRDLLENKAYPDFDHYTGATSWVRKIPEHYQTVGMKGTTRFILAGTDFTAIVLHHQWRDKIVFADEETKTLFKFLIGRFMSQTKNAIMLAKFKVNQELPTLPEDWQYHPTLKLSDYQRLGVLAALGRDSFSYFMQQGTGKTPTAISLICLEAARTRAGLMGKPHMMRVLVVCPRSVRTNWQNEIERWCTVPGKVTQIRGGKIRRMKAVVDTIRAEDDCAFSVAIASYESVAGTMEAITRVPWDRIIVDESHMIKSPNAARSKALRKLRENSARRLILTGTPIANTPMDLWSQFEFLDEGLSGFMNFRNFRKFFGKWEKKNGFEALKGLKNIPLVQERLARLAFVITKEEAGLGLPEKVYDMREVEMTKNQLDVYTTLATQMLAEIDAILHDGTSGTISAEHILTKLLRLAQVTSGHIKVDEVRGDEGEVLKKGYCKQIPPENPKVDELISILQEDRLGDPNSKCIVWAAFVEDIRVIAQRLMYEGINFVGYHPAIPEKYRCKDAETASEKFNCDPECTVFIGNPQSGGTGLNLLGYDWKNDSGTTYADHMIFFSQNWSAVLRSQAEDRAHRRGTRANVRITDLQVIGTIDEEIRRRVTEKRKMSSSIQEVRSILENIMEVS